MIGYYIICNYPHTHMSNYSMDTCQMGIVPHNIHCSYNTNPYTAHNYSPHRLYTSHTQNHTLYKYHYTSNYSGLSSLSYTHHFKAHNQLDIEYNHYNYYLHIHDIMLGKSHKCSVLVMLKCLSNIMSQCRMLVDMCVLICTSSRLSLYMISKLWRNSHMYNMVKSMVNIVKCSNYSMIEIVYQMHNLLRMCHLQQGTLMKNMIYICCLNMSCMIWQ